MCAHIYICSMKCQNGGVQVIKKCKFKTVVVNIRESNRNKVTSEQEVFVAKESWEEKKGVCRAQGLVEKVAAKAVESESEK